MEISVDISLYPLQEGYEKPILAFIAALEKEQSVDCLLYTSDAADDLYTV